MLRHTTRGEGTGRGSWPSRRRRSRPGAARRGGRADVKGDEGKNGSHTIDRHVDQTIAGMRRRLRENPNMDEVSRFVDESAAQRFTDGTLIQPRNQQRISDWISRGPRGKLELENEFHEPTGLHLTRHNFTHGEPTTWVNNVRVILKADPSAPSGYRVLTAYPVP
ncbi:RNase A-like domain-containing protein [Streptomyces regalis]|uniref:RNase A-like domain-containing protein n=1 Tax=Streptomyces regalis TaxID=68262 RepID=UPI002446792D|nr:RNase A-like domain-containing protein [Streptomyces regalis]